MAESEKKLAWTSISNHFDFTAGSEVRQIVAVGRVLRTGHGNGEDFFGKDLLFDWPASARTDLGGVLGTNADELFSPDSFVQALFPTDAESRQIAEAEGKFSNLPADWHRSSGATQDNMGASADPNIGLVLFRLNEADLRRKIDHGLREIADHDRQGAWRL